MKSFSKKIIASSLLIPSFFGIASPNADGLVSHWSGAIENTNAVDVSFNGHNGTLMNGVTNEQGVIGEAFVFNGVNSHIEVADSNAWAFGSNEFTISFWIKPTAYNSSYTRVLSHWQWSGGTNRAWEFYINRGKLTFASQGAFSLTSSSSLTLNEWNHVTLTRNGSTAKMYLDGIVQSTNNSAGASLNDSSATLFIGAAADRDGVTAHPGDMFYGLMDEIKVYHRALTDDEVNNEADPNPEPPVSFEPEEGTVSEFYPAATNCNLAYSDDGTEAYASAGSYHVKQGKLMLCNLPINPGKYVERIVLDYKAQDMEKLECNAGFVNATSSIYPSNTMAKANDGGIDILHIDDLGATEAYSYGKPHNTLLLSCGLVGFEANYSVNFGIIRVDYAAQ